MRRSRILGVFAAAVFVLFLVLAFSVHYPSNIRRGIERNDIRTHAALQEVRELPGAPQVFLGITYICNPDFVVAFEACVLALIFISRRKRVAALFLVSALGSEAVSVLIKNTLKRPRPPHVLFNLMPSGYSFPSGHALLAMVFYGFLGFFLVHLLRQRWQKILIAAVTTLLVIAVGFSRMFLEVHWFSDVIGGWLLGGAFLLASVAVFYRIHSHKKNESIADLRPHEKAGIMVISLILVAFLVYYGVTHVAEFRSIV